LITWNYFTLSHQFYITLLGSLLVIVSHFSKFSCILPLRRKRSPLERFNWFNLAHLLSWLQSLSYNLCCTLNFIGSSLITLVSFISQILPKKSKGTTGSRGLEVQVRKGIEELEMMCHWANTF